MPLKQAKTCVRNVPVMQRTPKSSRLTKLLSLRRLHFLTQKICAKKLLRLALQLNSLVRVTRRIEQLQLTLAKTRRVKCTQQSAM
jgi:hypothetical protein